MGQPSPNCRLGVDLGGQWAGAGDRNSGNDLYQASSENHASQWVASQIGIDRQGTESVGSEQAAATLRQFLLRIEDKQAGANVASGSARVSKTECAIRCSGSVGVGEIVDLQRVSWRRGYRRCCPPGCDQ